LKGEEMLEAEKLKGVVGVVKVTGELGWADSYNLF
jgi:hypothetical protein